MTLFKPAEVTSAYLKSGFLGFQGSGKTMTTSLLAIGLVLHMRKLGIEYANRPVFFLDTETGSDWVKPLFEEMGVALHVAKTRAFSDLIEAIDEAQKSASFLLVDSVTHYWTELTDSYARAKQKKFNMSGPYRLQFQDWGYLKGPDGWRKFTDRYINSSLHIGLCGRAGYEYDYFENDDGKKELEKTGVKMKAEGEFGFEPSLLVQMELRQKVEGKAVAQVWREAHILKDRSNLIDGKTFTFTAADEHGSRLPTHELVLQTFRAFQPHIKRLNLGGKQLGVDTTRTSEHAVQVDRKDWNSTHKTIVLEEIDAVLTERWPSTGKEDKLAKAAAIFKHFETRSWTEVENMRTDELRLRFDALHRDLLGEPSRYARQFAPERTTTDIDDEIPLAGGGTDAGGAISLKDKLLADLPDLKTPAELLHWGLEASQLKDLSEPDRQEINRAILVRQAEIAKLPKPEGEQPEDEKQPEKPNKAKAKGATKPELQVAE
jgi:hypothetical protein